MGTSLDLTGRVFGRWTVERPAPRQGWHRYWWCRCECGTTASRRERTLLDGSSQSCGCRRIELQTKHGHTSFEGPDTPEYLAWHNVKDRCGNPNATGYVGDRGITMEPAWATSFEAFLRDMGPKPAGYYLARRDRSIGFTKKNCYWAPRRSGVCARRPAKR